MELQIRPYTADDIKAMVRIWNEVVEGEMSYRRSSR